MLLYGALLYHLFRNFRNSIMQPATVQINVFVKCWNYLFDFFRRITIEFLDKRNVTLFDDVSYEFRHLLRFRKRLHRKGAFDRVVLPTKFLTENIGKQSCDWSVPTAITTWWTLQRLASDALRLYLPLYYFSSSLTRTSSLNSALKLNCIQKGRTLCVLFAKKYM